MSTTQRTVTIVGGGIGGLALAAALDPTRFDVTLLEAEPSRRSLGAGIGLWPAARRALSRVGAWGDLDDETDEGQVAGSLFDIHGRRLVTVAGPDLLVVERPRLMAALARAVPPSVRMRVARIDDPAGLPGDLVVGADGVRSRVRALVHPPAAERVETDYVALRGIAARSDPSDIGEYWGPGRLFGLAPLRDDRGYWFTTHRSALRPEPLPVQTVLAEARERFGDAAPVARRILELARADDATSATRMWTVPAMPRYVRGRYIVIGDAAHASLPNLGRGACDAILDAVSLARTLNGGGRLATWQARRLPVTQAARVTASGIMRFALLDRGHEARDRTVAALGRVGRAR